jgi:hypothetical protein
MPLSIQTPAVPATVAMNFLLLTRISSLLMMLTPNSGFKHAILSLCAMAQRRLFQQPITFDAFYQPVVCL